MNLSLLSEENIYFNENNIFTQANRINLSAPSSSQDTQKFFTPLRDKNTIHFFYKPSNPRLKLPLLTGNHANSDSTQSNRQDINMSRIYQAPVEMLSTFIETSKSISENILNTDNHHYENVINNQSSNESSQNIYNHPNLNNDVHLYDSLINSSKSSRDWRSLENGYSIDSDDSMPVDSNAAEAGDSDNSFIRSLNNISDTDVNNSDLRMDITSDASGSNLAFEDDSSSMEELRNDQQNSIDDQSVHIDDFNQIENPVSVLHQHSDLNQDRHHRDVPEVLSTNQPPRRSARLFDKQQRHAELQTTSPDVLANTVNRRVVSKRRRPSIKKRKTFRNKATQTDESEIMANRIHTQNSSTSEGEEEAETEEPRRNVRLLQKKSRSLVNIMPQQRQEHIVHDHQVGENQEVLHLINIELIEHAAHEAIHQRPIEEIVQPSTSAAVKNVTIRRGHPAHPKNKNRVRVTSDSNNNTYDHLVNAPGVTLRRKKSKRK